MNVCGCLRLFKAYLWVGVPFWTTFMDECECLEDICGWVCLCRILVWMGVGGCDCSNHIYGWVYLFRIHLWVGVGCLRLFKAHLWVGVPF